MTLHVLCVAYNRILPLRGLIDSFMNQTDNRWTLTIMHDGPAPEGVQKVVTDTFYTSDGRIHYRETPQCNGAFGHPNRKLMLENLAGACDDYVLITNDDNYYVPAFVRDFLKECGADVGMVYCNTLHSYMQYTVMYTRVKECFIDMGSFIVRSDIAKSVGFNQTNHSADGKYAEECAAACSARNLRVIYVDKPLFIHN
jgi:Glycosyl transferase family 2